MELVQRVPASQPCMLSPMLVARVHELDRFRTRSFRTDDELPVLPWPSLHKEIASASDPWHLEHVKAKSHIVRLFSGWSWEIESALKSYCDKEIFGGKNQSQRGSSCVVAWRREDCLPTMRISSVACIHSNTISSHSVFLAASISCDFVHSERRLTRAFPIAHENPSC
jgi:hypothetical protein